MAQVLSTENLCLYAFTMWESDVKCCSGYQARASVSLCLLPVVIGGYLIT